MTVESDYYKQQCDELEKMYIKDTAALQSKIGELEKERDQWKNRCLEAEADKVKINRSMRHV